MGCASSKSINLSDLDDSIHCMLKRDIAYYTKRGLEPPSYTPRKAHPFFLETGTRWTHGDHNDKDNDSTDHLGDSFATLSNDSSLDGFVVQEVEAHKAHKAHKHRNLQST